MANGDSEAHPPHVFTKFLTGSFKGESTIPISQRKIASDYLTGYKERAIIIEYVAYIHLFTQNKDVNEYIVL